MGENALIFFLKENPDLFTHGISHPCCSDSVIVNMSGSYGNAMWFSVIYVESFSPPKRNHLFLYDH